jgi:site-specific recombinase XerD
VSFAASTRPRLRPKSAEPQPVRVEVAEGDLRGLSRSFERSLRALNRSPATIRIYTISVAQLAVFLKDQGMPLVAANITREHIEEWLGSILETSSPSTAVTRHRGAKAFFAWLVDEGEIQRSPMERVKPPKTTDVPPPMLTDAQVRALLKTCEGGKTFTERRDLAIMRLLFDTGMRRSELAYLSLEDLDLDNNLVRVLGKGARVRIVPFGRKSAAGLDRYLRERDKHFAADSDALWLGRGGAMGDGAVDLMLRRRAKEAGLKDVHAHVFRHGFAHNWLSQGGQEQDLMQLAGWRSREMVSRYGRAAAADRAREAYRRLSPGDRL